LHRNYFTKYIIERKTSKRRKQLLDDLKETRRYWKMKEEAPDRNLWCSLFGRGYGPVVRLRHDGIQRI